MTLLFLLALELAPPPPLFPPFPSEDDTDPLAVAGGYFLQVPGTGLYTKGGHKEEIVRLGCVVSHPDRIGQKGGKANDDKKARLYLFLFLWTYEKLRRRHDNEWGRE